MDAGEECAAFQEKVRRTVCISDLSPLVTEPILRTALDQFMSVKSVEFIPNYTNMKNMPRCALVELEDPEHAKLILELISECPLMIGGMPRPVTACPATVGMFADRPQKPGRRIEIQWLEPDDPRFENAQKLKRLAQKHTAEASFLLQCQLIEEQKLAKQHQDVLAANYDKHQKIDSIKGAARRLAQYYDMNVMDD
ncbi:hypothetical protein MLD38_038462 [Melastoma candidum]|uniref:Uncharacterized protein n=1 Tax=Melastoma candidum TaxID=119954 RepID=A0ACB9L0G2_9MYRT|nr:hypothetical protein MLD38_038462 [Melastoma candidum]